MKALIQRAAGELGFALVGITTAEPVQGLEYIQEAISAGRIGTMRWLARNPERRCDPGSILPGAKSVICCAYPYGERGCHSEPRHGRGEESPGPSVQGDSSLTLRMTPAVARFARGAEYHDAVRRRLESLWRAISTGVPGARAKFCVDTSPVLEKALAERAGLGWIGKHAVLLNEKGSWFVLGEIITDIELEADAPAENLCGDCRACVDACPSGAIVAPYTLDARRCISYLTIEHGGEIPGNMRHYIRDGAYGCDMCQEACPYNKLSADS